MKYLLFLITFGSWCYGTKGKRGPELRADPTPIYSESEKRARRAQSLRYLVYPNYQKIEGFAQNVSWNDKIPCNHYPCSHEKTYDKKEQH